MKLEEIAALFRPLTQPKKAGLILSCSLAAAASLAYLDYSVTNTRVNELYIRFGGTDCKLSRYEKAEYIRNHPQYDQHSSYAKFLDKIKD